MVCDNRASALKEELAMNSVELSSNGYTTAPRNSNSVLMSRKEAAAYLGVAEITLAIWCSTGRYKLPVYKIGRLAKYKQAELDAFITSRIANI